MLVGLTAAVSFLMGFMGMAPASACACGEINGVVMAHGSSLYGVPWRIKGALLPPTSTTHSRYLEVEFSIGPTDGYTGVGSFTGLPLPLRPAFVFTGTSGSQIDQYPESNLSGVTNHNVTKLVVEMNEGDPLTVYPSFAPPGVRRRYPWLRAARVFDVFFPSSVRARVVTAYDRNENVLARRKAYLGSFFERSGRRGTR
jgi:hypothetical protein